MIPFSEEKGFPKYNWLNLTKIYILLVLLDCFFALSVTFHGGHEFSLLVEFLLLLW